MLNLPDVTLIAVACTHVSETIDALRQSQRQIAFHSCLLLTDQVNLKLPASIQLVKIKPLNYKQYNRFILFSLRRYVKTKYCLLVQNDGYVLNPEQWQADFLRYDYIGAPWPANVHFTPKGQNVRVGNGGFSLRSQKLLAAPSKLGLTFTDKGTGYFHEDGFISVYYRQQLEKAGIKIAPVSVASRFSREVTCPDSVAEPFGFHGKNNVPLSHRLWFYCHRKLRVYAGN